MALFPRSCAFKAKKYGALAVLLWPGLCMNTVATAYLTGSAATARRALLKLSHDHEGLVRDVRFGTTFFGLAWTQLIVLFVALLLGMVGCCFLRYESESEGGGNSGDGGVAEEGRGYEGDRGTGESVESMQFQVEEGRKSGDRENSEDGLPKYTKHDGLPKYKKTVVDRNERKSRSWVARQRYSEPLAASALYGPFF